MSSLIKGVTYNSKGEVVDCLFCRITSRNPNEPATIINEDSSYVCFVPLGAVTKSHLLISPKRHVQNVKSLKKEDSKMVSEMVEFAKASLAKFAPGAAEEASLCFHAPPFNSIDHLHLHAIGEPRAMGLLARLKYWPDTPWCTRAQTLIGELNQLGEEDT